jgi:hypothetical protein
MTQPVSGLGRPHRNLLSARRLPHGACSRAGHVRAQAHRAQAGAGPQGGRQRLRCRRPAAKVTTGSQGTRRRLRRCTSLHCQLAVQTQDRHLQFVQDALGHHSSFWAATAFVWGRRTPCAAVGLEVHCKVAYSCLVRVYILADSVPTPMAQNTLLPDIPKVLQPNHTCQAGHPNPSIISICLNTFARHHSCWPHACQVSQDPRSIYQDLHACSMMEATAEPQIQQNRTVRPMGAPSAVMQCSQQPARLAEKAAQQHGQPQHCRLFHPNQ